MAAACKYSPARFSTGTFAERASRMRLAVGAYSGPRTVCGAVAQLAKNARHVTAAITRTDIVLSSGFIIVGCVQTVGDDSQKFSTRSRFSCETLGLCGNCREIRGHRSAPLTN